jgi:hypothetical protein
MLRLLSNVTYPGHARLATDRRLLEGDNWNCGCDGANRDEHLTLEPRDPPLGTRQNYTRVSDQFWPDAAVRDVRSKRPLGKSGSRWEWRLTSEVANSHYRPGPAIHAQKNPRRE